MAKPIYALPEGASAYCTFRCWTTLYMPSGAPKGHERIALMLAPSGLLPRPKGVSFSCPPGPKGLKGGLPILGFAKRTQRKDCPKGGPLAFRQICASRAPKGQTRCVVSAGPILGKAKRRAYPAKRERSASPILEAGPLWAYIARRGCLVLTPFYTVFVFTLHCFLFDIIIVLKLSYNKATQK